MVSQISADQTIIKKAFCFNNTKIGDLLDLIC